MANERVDPARLYLSDLGSPLIELVGEAKAAREAAQTDTDRAFAEGRLMALYEVVSLMQQQAEAFGGLTQAEIFLVIDPERELL